MYFKYHIANKTMIKWLKLVLLDLMNFKNPVKVQNPIFLPCYRTQYLHLHFWNEKVKIEIEIDDNSQVFVKWHDNINNDECEFPLYLCCINIYIFEYIYIHYLNVTRYVNEMYYLFSWFDLFINHKYYVVFTEV